MSVLPTSQSTAAVGQTSVRRKGKKHAASAADAAHFAALMARQRERYAAAFARRNDAERSELARAIYRAAALFEADAKHMPSRARKAVELLKSAVFLLDPGAPA